MGGIGNVAGGLSSGIQDIFKGTGEIATAPLQKFNKGGNSDNQGASSCCNDMINNAKGCEQNHRPHHHHKHDKDGQNEMPPPPPPEMMQQNGFGGNSGW